MTLLVSALILGFAAAVPSSFLVVQDQAKQKEIPFRTYSQKEWSAKCQDNSLPCLLEARFQKLFPGGLIVGDRDGVDADDEYSFVLQSPEDVQKLLPVTGDSRSFQKDPSQLKGAREAGSFLGTLVTAKLNVEFDRESTRFTSGSGTLGNVAFAANVAPKLNGMTIRQALQIADRMISGRYGKIGVRDYKRTQVDVDKDGNLDVTMQDVHEALMAFNSGFAEGNKPGATFDLRPAIAAGAVTSKAGREPSSEQREQREQRRARNADDGAPKSQTPSDATDAGEAKRPQSRAATRQPRTRQPGEPVGEESPAPQEPAGDQDKPRRGERDHDSEADHEGDSHEQDRDAESHERGDEDDDKSHQDGERDDDGDRDEYERELSEAQEEFDLELKKINEEANKEGKPEKYEEKRKKLFEKYAEKKRKLDEKYRAEKDHPGRGQEKGKGKGLDKDKKEKKDNKEKGQGKSREKKPDSDG